MKTTRRTALTVAGIGLTAVVGLALPALADDGDTTPEPTESGNSCVLRDFAAEHPQAAADLREIILDLREGRADRREAVANFAEEHPEAAEQLGELRDERRADRQEQREQCR
ncbi:hypothetical protein BH20ACT5_BH20ACT5_23310 [soil metagenome]